MSVLFYKNYLVFTIIVSTGLYFFSTDSMALTQYHFLGDPASLMPTQTNSNITASNINFTDSVATQFNSVNSFLVIPNGGSTTAEQSVANNSFFQFTIVAETGYAINLLSLTFDNAYGNNNFGSGWVLRSSIDNFSTNIASQVVPIYYDFPGFTSQSVALNTPEYQGLTSPLTFRVYSFGSVPSEAAMAYANLALNGTTSTVAPIPDAIWLVSSGLIGFVRFVRRKAARVE